jgi:hypothetical protein
MANIGPTVSRVHGAVRGWRRVALLGASVLLLGAQDATKTPRASPFMTDKQAKSVLSAMTACQSAIDGLGPLMSDFASYAQTSKNAVDGDLAVACANRCGNLCDGATTEGSLLGLLSEMKCSDDFNSVRVPALLWAEYQAKCADSAVQSLTDRQGRTSSPAIVLACDKAKALATQEAEALRAVLDAFKP